MLICMLNILSLSYVLLGMFISTLTLLRFSYILLGMLNSMLTILTFSYVVLGMLISIYYLYTYVLLGMFISMLAISSFSYILLGMLILRSVIIQSTCFSSFHALDMVFYNRLYHKNYALTVSCCPLFLKVFIIFH